MHPTDLPGRAGWRSTGDGRGIGHDDVVVLEQGSLTLAHDGEGGIVHGQVMVLVRHERGILFDGVEVAIGRDPAFLPVGPLARQAAVARQFASVWLARSACSRCRPRGWWCASERVVC